MGRIFVGVVEVYEDDSEMLGTGVLNTETKAIEEIDGFPNGTREHEPVRMYIIMPSGNRVPIIYDGREQYFRIAKDGETSE